MSPDTEAPPTDEAEAAPRDEAREAVLERFSAELGDAVVDSHIAVGSDPVGPRHRRGLAHRRPRRPRPPGLPLLRLPVGHRLAALALRPLRGRRLRRRPADPDTEIVTGYAGGDTRFQVFARVVDVADRHRHHPQGRPPRRRPHRRHLGARSTPGPTGTSARPGRCSASPSPGHPGLRHIYLPGDFEGYPLRKDFPLLARIVKPWPGIVDVEPMPADDEDEAADTAEGGDGE